MMKSTTLLAAAAALLLLAPAAQAQGWDPTGRQLTRAELEALLAQYEEAASSGSYSNRARDEARMEAALIRQRLDEGDIRVGDRIFMSVRGFEAYTDTFTVVAGRSIVLPEIGEIPLEGVLRSELTEHLRRELGRYIRDPVVESRSLIRLEIMGAIGQPGFYTLPSDILVSDALMIAGGPAGNANVEEITVQRSGETIWEEGPLRAALIEGRTLDQLSLRAGDRIQVPEGRSTWSKIQAGLGVLGAIGSLIWVGNRAGIF